jgi:hypothetical protein
MQFSLSRARSINLQEVEHGKQLQHYVEEWVGVCNEVYTSLHFRPLTHATPPSLSVPVAQGVRRFVTPLPAISSSCQP